MKKAISLLLIAMLAMSLFVGCGSKEVNTNTEDNQAESSSNNEKSDDPITIVWYPNESGEDLKSARDEIGRVVEEATGKKVEQKLTTDYAIAIEAVANGTADMCWMGAQGYVETHKKNDKVLPLVVYTGESGTLEDAVYYSWLAVKDEDAEEHKNNGAFIIDSIAGKKFSFVSNSSTSGFKVPSAVISSYFSKKQDWSGLTGEDLMEGGKGRLFSEVLYGGSHQGSAVNLISGRADVAAFCDSCVGNYIEHIDGKHNRAGARYRVKDDAAEPFNKVVGEEFVLISTTPVLNEPFVVNTESLSKEDQEAIKTALTSDEVANNDKIFVPEDSEYSGIWEKEGKECFVEVDDAWFEPIRELSK